MALTDSPSTLELALLALDDELVNLIAIVDQERVVCTGCDLSNASDSPTELYWWALGHAKECFGPAAMWHLLHVPAVTL